MSSREFAVNRLVSFPNGIIIKSWEATSNFNEVQVEDKRGYVEYDAIVIGRYSANNKVDDLKRQMS